MFSSRVNPLKLERWFLSTIVVRCWHWWTIRRVTNRLTTVFEWVVSLIRLCFQKKLSYRKPSATFSQKFHYKHKTLGKFVCHQNYFWWKLQNTLTVDWEKRPMTTGWMTDRVQRISFGRRCRIIMKIYDFILVEPFLKFF